MLKTLQAIIGVVIAVALVYPMAVTAIAAGYIYYGLFISLVIIGSYFFFYVKGQKVVGAFLCALITGFTLSLALWGINFIGHVARFTENFYFMGSFLVLFCLTALVVVFAKKSKIKKTIFFVVNAAALIALTFILIFAEKDTDSIGLSIVIGAIVGIFAATIAIYVFEGYMRAELSVFAKICDYIVILVKPASMFFAGYVMIGVIFAGIYNLVYIYHPNSLGVPAGQDAFLDFIIYSLDSMSTGGSSPINSNSTLAQGINALNVFCSILWMTIMLAAVIGHASEAFNDITEKHKKENKRKKVAKKKAAKG